MFQLFYRFLKCSNYFTICSNYFHFPCQSLDGFSGTRSWGGYVEFSDDGSILAVGGTDYSDSGFVNVFQYSEVLNIWSQIGSNITGNIGDSQQVVALSADGTTLAIGAFTSDDEGSDAGKAVVFNYNGVDWVPKGTPETEAIIPGEEGSSYFGLGMALNDAGNVLAIGAPTFSAAGIPGRVRVYFFNGTIWKQRGVTLSGSQVEDQFGRHISLSSDGNVLGVGAISDDTLLQNSGSAQTFQYNELSGNYEKIGQTLYSMQSFEVFGHNTELSSTGDILAVSATGRRETDLGVEDADLRQGAVRLYKFAEELGTWVQASTDIGWVKNGQMGYFFFFGCYFWSFKV